MGDVRLEAPVAEDRDYLISIAWARHSRIQDQGFRGHFSKAKWPLPLQKRMAERQSDHEPLLAQDVTTHGRIVKPYPAEADIDPAVLQGRDLFKTCHLDEADVESGRFRAETPDQVG